MGNDNHKRQSIQYHARWLFVRFHTQIQSIYESLDTALQHDIPPLGAIWPFAVNLTASQPCATVVVLLVPVYKCFISISQWKRARRFYSAGL